MSPQSSGTPGQARRRGPTLRSSLFLPPLLLTALVAVGGLDLVLVRLRQQDSAAMRQQELAAEEAIAGLQQQLATAKRSWRRHRQRPPRSSSRRGGQGAARRTPLLLWGCAGCRCRWALRLPAGTRWCYRPVSPAWSLTTPPAWWAALPTPGWCMARRLCTLPSGAAGRQRIRWHGSVPAPRHSAAPALPRLQHRGAAVPG